MSTAFLRGAIYFAVWWVLVRGDPAYAWPGLCAAFAATWLSLVLMPPTAGRVHPLRLARLLARFFWHSLAAGFDVARRAFSPSVPLQLGFVTYRVGIPPGPARNLFRAMTALMPGTLPMTADEPDALLYHCLDVRQPVAEQLAEEEARFVAAMGGPSK